MDTFNSQTNTHTNPLNHHTGQAGQGESTPGEWWSRMGIPAGEGNQRQQSMIIRVEHWWINTTQ
jgi:hypothetical protein